MAVSVGTANSMKLTTEVCMMSWDERVRWFIGIYNDVKGRGCNTNSNSGARCVLAYVKREMKYKTAGYLIQYG